VCKCVNVEEGGGYTFELDPGGQSRHAVCAEEGWYFPAAQDGQLHVPDVAEYFPAVQAVTVVAPLAE